MSCETIKQAVQQLNSTLLSTIRHTLYLKNNDIENFENFTDFQTTTTNQTDFDPGGHFIEKTCDSFYVYLQFLHTYYIPFIIAVGFIGNVLSCIVFLTTHLRMRSLSYYLAALAVADFGFLAVVLIVYCSFNNVFDIYNTNGWCQFSVYLSSVCASLSVWLVVAFTVERFIAVQYPLQRPHICTVSIAKAVVASLTIFALVSQSYLFWIVGMVPIEDRLECEMRPVYLEFMRVVNFIDTFTTLIIPLLLILIMNAMIARNLLLFRKRMQANCIDDYLHQDQDQTELQDVHPTQTSSSNRRQGSQHSHKSNMSRTSNMVHRLERYPCIYVNIPTSSITSTRNQQNVTKVLLLISSVFIALNFPIYVIRLSVFFGYTLQQRHPPEILYCLQQLAMLLFNTNFSINFLLYAMFDITFRRCLGQLLRNNFKRLSGSRLSGSRFSIK